MCLDVLTLEMGKLVSDYCQWVRPRVGMDS